MSAAGPTASPRLGLQLLDLSAGIDNEGREPVRLWIILRMKCALPRELHTAFLPLRRNCRCGRTGFCSTLSMVRGSVGTLDFGGIALVGPGASRPLSWKRGKLPQSDGPTGGPGLHRPGSTGVGAEGPWLHPARGVAAGPKHRSSDAGSLSQDQPEGRFARHPAQCGEAAEAARPARVSPLKRVPGRCPVSPDGCRGIRRQAG
jgi:hypothetical protein